jgi:hypothetical protein
MSWGFLGEFWDSVASSTLNAWEYTTGWFQNIGLAVAGALGSLFDYLIHSISDFFVFMGWIFSAIKELALAIVLPINYTGSFLRAFVSNAVKSPATPEASYVFSTSTMSIFETLPYWDILGTTLGICLLVIGGIAIVKLVLKV